MNHYGVLSLLPPLLSLCLAVFTRNVLVALFCGGFFGAVLINNGNPLNALLYFLENLVFNQVSQPMNAQLILLMAVIGGFIGLIEYTGLANSFAKKMTTWIQRKKTAQLVTWFGGVVISFSDTANSLVLGPIFRPIYDELRISREKLAYILDSTSSPDCVLIPFIGWGVFIMSLIETSFFKMGLHQNTFEVFIGALPYQLYPILTLFLVPTVILFGFDFSKMKHFEKKLQKQTEKKTKQQELEQQMPAPLIVISMTLLIGLIAFFFLLHFFKYGSLSGEKIRVSLFAAYIITSLVSGFLIVRTKKFKSKKLWEFYLSGVHRSLPIMLLLILAWSLADVCAHIGTGVFIGSLIGTKVSAHYFLPVLFFLGAITSFATGTSWGTFSILMPLAIPLAHQNQISLVATVGTVLSGGIFGDHASPIADTTLLASIGSECPISNHVNTQLPYAILSAFVALVGFGILGFLSTPWLIVPLVVVQALIVFGLKYLRRTI